MATYRYYFLLLIIIPMLGVAADLPHALTDQGKPIDPLCFFELESSSGVSSQVNLTQCGLHAEKGRSISGKNEQLIAKGFIGYDYKWHLGDGVEIQGYSYYKPIADIDGGVVLFTRNNGGGTGQFSSLLVVSRLNKNTISLKPLGGGDRCNGGLEDVKRSGNTLFYEVNMTASDFLAFNQSAARTLKPYDDLDACAICCKAVALFERKLDDFQHEQLVSIDLAAYPDSLTMEDESASQYQACFDKLLKRYIHNNKPKMTAKQVTMFMNEFSQRCIDSKND